MEQAVRDAMIGFMAAMAQAQAEVTKEAQRAGIAHAKASDNGKKYRGRKPTFTPEQYWAVRELLDRWLVVSEIAKQTGVSRQSIYRIRTAPERQLAALTAWYGELISHQSP
jgi:DNA invertase Pin-like site-specific DNA recombinase